MIVIDTSVFTDFFVNFDKDRYFKAKMLFDKISKDFIIYEPFLFDVELVDIFVGDMMKELFLRLLKN